LSVIGYTRLLVVVVLHRLVFNMEKKRNKKSIYV